MWFWLQRARLVASTPTWAFGNVGTGAAGVDMAASVTSSVAQTLNLTIVEDQVAPFSIASAHPLPVQANQPAAITVHFAPQAAGIFTGRLRIAGDNDVDFLRINLSGTGTPPVGGPV
jgi:hypothetical protein